MKHPQGDAAELRGKFWRALADSPPPMAIIHPRLVWTGQEVLVVGGYRPTSGTIQTSFWSHSDAAARLSVRATGTSWSSAP